MNCQEIEKEAREALACLLLAARPAPGQILVVGCSSSETAGGVIGRNSSEEAAGAVIGGLLPLIREHGLFLAAQCCEHLNRALIVERACMERYGLTEVFAVPVPHAGGAFAACAFSAAREPVAVEAIQAHMGMDIGDTLIGMHLRPVAVPVRGPERVGRAHLTMAYARPKYIGGARAVYST